jgi:glycerol uptake facilitator-like aquaporin
VRTRTFVASCSRLPARSLTVHARALVCVLSCVCVCVCLRRWPALGNGLTLAVMVYMTAKVSGGKLNPAVSLGLLVSGSIGASSLSLTLTRARMHTLHTCTLDWTGAHALHYAAQAGCAACWRSSCRFWAACWARP